MFYNLQLRVKETLTDDSGSSDAHNIAGFGEEAAQFIYCVQTVATLFCFRVNKSC